MLIRTSKVSQTYPPMPATILPAVVRPRSTRTRVATVGVEELDQSKLTPLLRLKYHNSIADAVADLGRPEEIGKVFAGFQKYLYQPAA